MLTNQTQIADLTVEELLNLIREELRQQPVAAPRRQAAFLELEPLHVGG